MERLQSFVVKGGIKLPVGFRFCPTDEELLLHYLKKKAFAEQLPASVISEFDVFQTEPWGLPGDDLREKRYFFSNRKDVVCGNINKRPAGSGFWKSVGNEKQIMRSGSNQVIGMRKTMIFCKGSHEIRTRWVMHELRLETSYPCPMPVADFAVYRIFQKKKMKTKRSHRKPSSTSKLERLNDVKASFIDFTVEFGHGDIGAPPPCSPCLSEGSSEISSSKLD
ncbi:NAC domain-containing protein 83 [Spatholobus suberectus]|nr:NAC domain-containing protein 83 [Spatholobus suberectus]